MQQELINDTYRRQYMEQDINVIEGRIEAVLFSVGEAVESSYEGSRVSPRLSNEIRRY